MLNTFNLYILSAFTLFNGVGSELCFGKRCETPNFLEDTKYCDGLGCESKESLLKMISHLQKEKYNEYMAPLKNPLMINKRTSKEVVLKEVFLTGQDDIEKCSICNNTALCLNGGACIPDPTNPWKYFHPNGRTKLVLVDDVQVLPPWFYPNKDNWIIRIRFTGTQWIVENEQGVTVTFTTTNSLFPTLCGLAGNLDGSWQNDVANSNGTFLPIHKDHQPDGDNRDDFLETEDSWITDQFLVLRDGQENCLNGEVINNNTNCDVSTVAQYCYSIQQAEIGIGPFSACQQLGNETLEKFYYNCIYDVCHDQNYKCTTLSYFMQYCQLNLPESHQDPNWRDEVNCSLACPVNSHHSICTSSCPSMCSDVYPEECDLACFDGCECNPGYVIDNSATGSIKCIRVDQCGCSDNDGNTHKPNTPWVTNNCTVFHECRNGTMYSEFRPCGPHAICTSSLKNNQCQCEKGFRGDGYNCTDSDECAETPGICGTHATCFNIPGSFKCECDTYYVGDACESYKPRRHCADLYVYWGNQTDGVYSINPPYALPQNKLPFEPSLVYCDMKTDGGGFTLVSSDVSNLNENKTYQEYIVGFGEPKNKSVWLGLEFIHQMTTNQSQTLRLNLDRCAGNGRPASSSDCTYSTFSVLGASTQYSVVIRETCTGSEADDHYYQDGWARWDLSKNGPKFTTWDLELESANKPQKAEEDDVNYSCSGSSLNTGWWYIENRMCGAANLNAVRYTCPDIPLDSEQYLRWSQGPLGQAAMYLRPVGYPKYDTQGQ